MCCCDNEAGCVMGYGYELWLWVMVEAAYRPGHPNDRHSLGDFSGNRR